MLWFSVIEIIYPFMSVFSNQDTIFMECALGCYPFSFFSFTQKDGAFDKLSQICQNATINGLLSHDCYSIHGYFSMCRINNLLLCMYVFGIGWLCAYCFEFVALHAIYSIECVCDSRRIKRK